MAGDITLLYDQDSVGTLNSQKVMVAVPLLYLFMVLITPFRPTTSFKYFG